MKRAALFLGVLALVAVLASPVALAEEGQWLVRLRALNLTPADESDPIPALGVKADDITVNDKTFPEVDISYFVTPNIALEMILTYPQKHDVKVEGLGKIGDFKHLPPTLCVQYHFLPEGIFRPYVGLGLNYTLIDDVDLAIDLGEDGILKPELDDSSFGWAIGAGFDVRVADQWFLNLDLKKVKIGSDIKVGGTKVSSVDIDPLLISAGVGYRF